MRRCSKELRLLILSDASKGCIVGRFVFTDVLDSLGLSMPLCQFAFTVEIYAAQWMTLIPFGPCFRTWAEQVVSATANIRNHNSDHATLLGLFASSVFSTFTLISLGLASTFFARRIFSTPFS